MAWRAVPAVAARTTGLAMASDQTGILQLAHADRHIERVGHQIDTAWGQVEFERDAGIVSREIDDDRREVKSGEVDWKRNPQDARGPLNHCAELFVCEPRLLTSRKKFDEGKTINLGSKGDPGRSRPCRAGYVLERGCPRCASSVMPMGSPALPPACSKPHPRGADPTFSGIKSPSIASIAIPWMSPSRLPPDLLSAASECSPAS